MIAVQAAAAAARAKTQLLDTFRVAGATAPERALPLARLGVDGQQSTFGTLVQAGVIRAVDARGRPAVLGDTFDRIAGYYLDEAAYVAHRDAASKPKPQLLVFVVIMMLVTVLCSGLALMISRGR
jgi:hypothetical protein